MKRTLLSLACLACVAWPLQAQDAIVYREKNAKGERPIKTLKGKIESESAAGVKVGASTISSGDIVEINYDVPGQIKLEYPRALNAEKRDATAAIKEYESLIPKVAAAKTIKRQFEYRIAVLKAQKADEGKDGLQQAIDALAKFRKENADGWQVVPATRLQARLLADKQPADYPGAQKVYEELAALPVPPEVKADCQYQIIDLLISAKKLPEAKAKAASLSSADPRTALYQLLAAADPAKLDDSIKKIEQFIEKQSDAGLKAAGYNALGDCYRLNPKKLKDALYAYLTVDVVYNQDPQESAKAIDRLAELFKEMKNDERAKLYRDKQKIR